MEAKEYLMQLHNIDKNIKALENEILELNTLAEGGAITYEERVQTSGRGSTEFIVCKIADKKSEIYDILNKKVELIGEISTKISLLNDNSMEALLRKRYIESRSWERIAVDMNYSIRRVYQLHGNALVEFDKILNKDCS